MKSYLMDEIVVRVKNEPGMLYFVSKDISNKGINIEVVSAYGIDSEAFIRIITHDPTTARYVLSKNPYVKDVIVKKVFVVEMEDKPGELAKLTEKIYKRGINLEVVYIANKEKGHSYVVVKPVDEHFDKMLEVLEE